MAKLPVEERATCGARCKRSGQPCRRAPVPGRTRCRLHGGNTPRGPAHHNFKTGRYSKCLPARLLEGYQEARTDPELLSLAEEVALCQSRIVELAGRLDNTDTAALWLDLRQALAQFDVGTPGALDTVRDLVSRGASDAEKWAALSDAMAEKARLAKVEWRRMYDLQMVMSADQVTTLVMALLDAVLRIVPEPDRRQQIAQQFNLLVDCRQPQPQEPVNVGA